jgi:hypothetical protein
MSGEPEKKAVLYPKFRSWMPVSRAEYIVKTQVGQLIDQAVLPRTRAG